MSRFSEIMAAIFSAVVALLRLVFLTCAMFASGVHIVLFTRTEVCNIEMRGMPWRCDRERDMSTLSFVDRLMVDNPDLLDYADEQMEKEGKFPPADDDDDDGMDI